MNVEKKAELQKLVLGIDVMVERITNFGKLNDNAVDVQSTIRYLNNASGSLRSIE